MEDIPKKLRRLNSSNRINQSQKMPVLANESISPFGLMDDNETDFVIENRTIISYVPLVDLILQFDSNSRILKFKFMRIFDNIDLSLKNVNVNFINANRESAFAPCIITSIEDDSFIVEWVIGSEVTAADGKVEYGIEFLERDLNNKPIYSWHTKPSYFNVEKSLIILSDVIPTDYIRQKTFYDENNNETEYLEIRDSDPIIQIDNRVILVGIQNDLVVFQDNLSQIISFSIPRYFQGTDLATKLICINYVNANGMSDMATVVNVKLSQLTIEFGWLLDNKVTQRSGIVHFSISFIGYNEKSEFFLWSTKIAQFNVEEGLLSYDEIPDPEPSWWQSIALELTRLKTGKADLIDGKIPDYQLPIGYGGDADLTQFAQRLSNLENKIDIKAQTIYADNYLLFPNIGNEKDIYIDKENNNTYRWDNTALKYYKIGSDYNNIGIIYGGNASG